MGIEILEDAEPDHQADADEQYESMRDDAYSAFADDIEAVLEKHNKKKGYYWDNPAKVRDHAMSIAANWRID